MDKFYFEIRLQNGEVMYNSINDDDTVFDTYKEAEAACDIVLDDIIESQDCDDDEKFIEGDFRTYILIKKS